VVWARGTQSILRARGPWLAWSSGPSTSPLAAMRTPWYSTWLVRPLAFLGVLVFLLYFSLSLLTGFRPEARFESSDGIWHDHTDHLKGRSFTTVIHDFDRYRGLCKRPLVTLVRTTRVAWWNAPGWYYYASAPEWRVPWQERHTCLNNDCSPAGSPACDGIDRLPSPDAHDS